MEPANELNVAERQSKLDGADVLISLQEENKCGTDEDGELHPNGIRHRIILPEEQLRDRLDEVERLSQLATSESLRADGAQNVLKEEASELESLMRGIKQKDGIFAGLEDEVVKTAGKPDRRIGSKAGKVALCADRRTCISGEFDSFSSATTAPSSQVFDKPWQRDLQSYIYTVPRLNGSRPWLYDEDLVVLDEVESVDTPENADAEASRNAFHRRLDILRFRQPTSCKDSQEDKVAGLELEL
ncbi:unnamed protein product [Haemonchus placei]|uniref:Fibrous sheath-interacting protein 1 n=1 Tax=Haemonchus placei TaxID=6290 RepID=A0A0N4X535_HAEPC|nr:unnamed protein product [Haemonchus placei]